jgi:hypothetical protein
MNMRPDPVMRHQLAPMLDDLRCRRAQPKWTTELVIAAMLEWQKRLVC